MFRFKSHFLTFVLFIQSEAFTLQQQEQQRRSHGWSLLGDSSSRPSWFLRYGRDFVDEMSEERKSTLFEVLLRDLEIEGVPLLGCDAGEATTFQAAVWTTMAEMSEKDQGDKACLVLEEIPVDALRAFADDFAMLKTQRRVIDHLPEMERLSVSLVGKGVGPALVIESKERTDIEKANYAAVRGSPESYDELKATSAMKSFVNRVVVGLGACPYTSSADVAPSILLEGKVQSGPIAYRSARSADALDVLAAFWNCACEVLFSSDEQLSTTVLTLPPTGSLASAHARFSAVAELMSRSLFLYRGQEVLELFHTHPLYDRDLIYPVDKPAHGHLPPTGWLRPLLKHNGNTEQAQNLSDNALKIQNYQRRSPLQAVIIKRVSHLNAATTPESGMVDLDVGGRYEKASGIPTYARNIIRLSGIGENVLQTSLNAEIALAQS
jgi:hypothetical protein